jgi:hypothetical protein
LIDSISYFLLPLPLKLPSSNSQSSWFADSNNTRTSSDRYSYSSPSAAHSPGESKFGKAGKSGTKKKIGAEIVADVGRYFIASFRCQANLIDLFLNNKLAIRFA